MLISSLIFIIFYLFFIYTYILKISIIHILYLFLFNYSWYICYADLLSSLSLFIKSIRSCFVSNIYPPLPLLFYSNLYVFYSYNYKGIGTGSNSLFLNILSIYSFYFYTCLYLKVWVFCAFFLNVSYFFYILQAI